MLFKEPEFMLLTTDITLERILRLIFPGRRRGGGIG
jgi:hypothetical protein